MFLAWNYTLEAFFWIIIGGITLISLTIFMARPKASAKSLLKPDYYGGEITENDSYSNTESNLQSLPEPEIEDLEPEEIAEAEFEAFVKKLPQSVQSIISIRAAIAVLYGLLILCFGFLNLEISGTECSNQNWVTGILFFSCSIHETAVFLTSIVGGIALIYGVNQKSPFMSRWGGRLIAIYCVFFLHDTSVYWFMAWKVFLTVLALIFSSDILSFWKWSNPYYNEKRARLLLYVLLIFFGLPYLVALIISLLN